MFENEREEDMPFNWGPSTENSAGGTADGVKAPVVQKGPTEADWENSSVKGFTREGKECRAVPWYQYGIRFVERSHFVQGFECVGEQAYADFPDLTQKLGMGQVMGYNLRNRANGETISPPGKWMLLGKPVTHPGVTPAWVAERLGDSRTVKVVRHCRVIDTNGKDMPLKEW